MTTPAKREAARRPLSTADLASAAGGREIPPDEEPVARDELAAQDEVPTVAGRNAVNRTALRRTSTSVEPAALAEAEIAEHDAVDQQALDEQGADRESAAGEPLAALFTPDLTQTYRSRWTSIQSSFVDDPRQAVRNGDELVAEVMTNLAKTFADERHRVEGQLDETGEGSTENLRLALRRYRSFFDRLLSL